LRAAAGTGIPVWLSYSIAGEHTRAGQPLAEAFAVAAGNDQVIAVGVNCSAPRDVQPAIEVAHAVTAKPAVAYPNSGEEWDAGRRTWHGPGGYDPSLAQSWLKAG